MKKNVFLIVLVCLLALSCVLFGCDNKEDISSLSLTAPNGITMRVGARTDVTKYFEKEGKGKIEYAVENADVLSIKGSTITALKEGTAYVVISGGEHVVRLYVEVSDGKRISFDLADTTAVYDGRKHNIAWYSDPLPEGTEVELYHNGERFDGATNAGTYEITFQLKLPKGYIAVSEKNRAVLTIQKARYRMSDVSFSNAQYEYDGNEHAVFLQGTLPEGISVRYENNRATEAGTYRAKAIFAGEDPNYEKIADMTSVLTIEKKIYALADNGFRTVAKTYDGEDVIETLTNLPEGCAARVYTENGEEARFVNAGNYEAYAQLTIDKKLYDNYVFMTHDKFVYFEKIGENEYRSEEVKAEVSIYKAELTTQRFEIRNRAGEPIETITYGQSITFAEEGGDVVFALVGDAPVGVKKEYEGLISYDINAPEKNAYGQYDSGGTHIVRLTYVLPEGSRSRPRSGKAR